MQCCTCSKCFHLRCSLPSISRFKTALTSGVVHTPTNTLFTSLGSSSLYTSTVLSGLSGGFSAKAALPPHPRLQTFYPLSAHFVSPPSTPSPLLMFLAVFLYLLLPLLFLARSGFFNEMPEVFEPETLNYSTLSRLIL